MKYYHAGGCGYGDILLALGVELNLGNHNQTINFVHGTKFLKQKRRAHGLSFKEIFEYIKTEVADAENIKFEYTYSENKDYLKYGIKPDNILNMNHHWKLKRQWDFPQSKKLLVCVPDHITKLNFKKDPSYKDFNYDSTIRYAERLSEKYGWKIEYVTHDDHPKTIIDKILSSEMLLSYDGGIAWLGAWAGCPTTVVTSKVKSSRARHGHHVNIVLHDQLDNISYFDHILPCVGL